MNILTQIEGYIFLFLFAITMLIVTTIFTKKSKNYDNFIISDRNIKWWLGAPSIAASWIWAPALFVSVQKAYELGLPGIFWFTVPNIIALAIFAILGPKIRQKLPNGYTLPNWIKHKFGKTVHKVYLVPFFWYQLMAVCVQIFVGGMMLEFLTGIPLNTAMVLLSLIGLSYSLLSGLKASIVTDLVQIIMIFIVSLIIIPWVIYNAGGITAVENGLGGLINNTNIFDPSIAFSFGIITSIGLLSGAISDQQYWQRSFAIKEKDIKKSFIIGSLLFGLVPITLSVLGFLAANQDLNISLSSDVGLPMIGVAVVAKLLPAWATILFVIMLLAGLTSTLDSAYNAASSLYISDIKNVPKKRESIIKEARYAMIGVAILGLILALIVQHLFSLDRLWWIFNGVAMCFVVPTILSLFWNKLSEKSVIYSIVIASIGMIVFVYGNWIKDDILTVSSAVFIIISSLIVSWIFREKG